MLTDDELTEQWLSGVKIAVIARRAEMSRTSIHRRLRALNLPLRGAGFRLHTPDLDARFTEMFHAQYTMEEIAHTLGIGLKTTHCWQKRLGLKRKKLNQHARRRMSRDPIPTALSHLREGVR